MDPVDPPHDRVEAEPASIVHVVVPAEASENGLAALPEEIVPDLDTADGTMCQDSLHFFLARRDG